MEKELWGVSSRPSQNGTIILTIVAVFLAGIGIGDILSKSKQANTNYEQSKLIQTGGSTAMIRTAIISVTASFVLFGAWAVNLVSYHPAADLNPLAPLSAPVDRK